MNIDPKIAEAVHKMNTPESSSEWESKLELGGNFIDLEGNLRPGARERLKDFIRELLASQKESFRRRVEELYEQNKVSRLPMSAQSILSLLLEDLKDL